MHFTIFVYGSWGDLRPHAVLGMGLQKAGHQVQVIASEVYKDWILSRGIEFYPLRDDVGKIMAEISTNDVFNPLEQIRLVREVLPSVFFRMGEDVLNATRLSDVLITVEFGLPVLMGVLEVNKLKALMVNPAPLNPTGEFASAAVPRVPGWFPFPEWYNRRSYSFVQRAQWSLTGKARRLLGEAHPELPEHRFKDYKALLASTPALTCVSQHLVPRPIDWPEHFQVTGYLLDDDANWTSPQDLTEFLAAGEPPVYIGFGSMPDSKPEATTTMIIEAVRKSGKRAVILTGWAGLGADDIPENIHILKYAPHSWLFPQMAAVVHHGGSGTTAAGLRAGVPTIIVPHNADQPYWGRMVEQLGVGTAPIPRKKLTVEKLAHAIQTVTTSQNMREKARTLSEKIQQEDGLAEAMKWVERLLA